MERRGDKMKEIQTNLYVTFDTEGSIPSDVIKRLRTTGFMPSQGSVDFVFSWDTKPTFEDIIMLLDKTHALLQGTHVKYSSETIGV